MSRINSRVKLMVLICVLAAVFIAIYIAGVLIPEEAVEGSFLDAGLAPCARHPFGTG